MTRPAAHFQIFQIEEIPGVKIFRFDSALLFANASLFRSQMYRYIQMDFEEMKLQVQEEERAAQLHHKELQKAIHSINAPGCRNDTLSSKVVNFFTPRGTAEVKRRNINGIWSELSNLIVELIANLQLCRKKL